MLSPKLRQAFAISGLLPTLLVASLPLFAPSGAPQPQAASPAAPAPANAKPLAWFTDEAPLRSGWAWGQTYLKGGVVAFEASVGKGKLITFGPEITFRGQAHGTFKLLFNELIQTGEVPKINLEAGSR